jgi:EAL and modified HD-GYP domain-containing signal transduction protein
LDHVYIGRQPILNQKSEICAYEILYRNSKKKATINDNRHASAAVINSILNKFGTKKLLGDRRAFVKIDEKFLMHDLIFSIPKEFFVFSFFASIEMSEKVVERIEQLHERGYVLSINDISLEEQTLSKYEKILPLVNYVKINFNIYDIDGEKHICEGLKKYDIIIIATKIEDAKTYEHAKEYGCDWYQGYFFSKPQILENEKYEPQQMQILKLYNLLMQDVNIDEITNEFENNPEITVQLLQFINSGAFHFKQRISSIHHVLTLVGRISIAQWLMLMIYSKSVSKSSEQSPLMLMVKNRTEMMERILKLIKPNVRSNALGEAYLVGVLSLMDNVFEVSLENLVETLNVSNKVKEALFEEKGVLGNIYRLVRYIENFNTPGVIKFEQRYKLEPGAINKIVLESMQEVHKFENH